jgi:hypothetical protein
LSRLREFAHRRNEATAQHNALLWPHFGLRRHLRSEAAWRYAELYWEDYITTDDPPSLALRFATLGEKLKDYNDFFATETFIGLDPEVANRINEHTDAEQWNERIKHVEWNAEPMPVDPRWTDNYKDDDEWVLYGEACAEMGLTKLPDWPELDRKLRQMLDRPDCYNDVTRVQTLTGSLVYLTSGGTPGNRRPTPFRHVAINDGRAGHSPGPPPCPP